MTYPIFFLRHGETELNAAQRIQGNAVDAPLTGLGRKQATAMATFLFGKGIVAIYVSPQGRAQSTAAIVEQALHVPVEICPFFHEMNFGHLTGLLHEEAATRFASFFAERVRDKAHTPFPGGESYQDVDTRIRPGLEAIVRSACGPIVFVGHEGINRIARAIVTGCPIETAVLSKQRNDEIIECLPDGKEIIHLLTP